MDRDTPYFSALDRKVKILGGYLNAHLHLDRSGTYFQTIQLLEKKAISDASYLSLEHKHSLIPLIHQSECYDVDALTSRTLAFAETMISYGTTRADTLVDVTNDNVQLTAFDAFVGIKDTVKDKLDFRIGAYSPLGFEKNGSAAWRLLETAAERADFLGSLPERDDTENYPDHIGFEEHCGKLLSLSMNLGKPLHIHVDQKNHKYEKGTRRVIDVLKSLAYEPDPDCAEPLIWLVHVISPSNYSESEFRSLLEDLKRFRIGVVVCPSAAISMRQIRSLKSPTHNSIARALEMLAYGIDVRIGSDNVCDITSPAGTLDLLSEVFVFSNALRFYNIDILAKIASGNTINAVERETIRAHLAADDRECRSTVTGLKALPREPEST